MKDLVLQLMDIILYSAFIQLHLLALLFSAASVTNTGLNKICISATCLCKSFLNSAHDFHACFWVLSQNPMLVKMKICLSFMLQTA